MDKGPSPMLGLALFGGLFTWMLILAAQAR